MVWVKVEPGIWHPKDAGDSIIGVLVRKEEGKGADNNSNAYFLDDGKEVKMVWGCKVLDNRMQFISVGERIKIEYGGKGKAKTGRMIHLYEVYKDDEVKVPVA